MAFYYHLLCHYRCSLVDGHLCNLKKVIEFAKTSKVIENSCNLGIYPFSRLVVSHTIWLG